MPKDEYDFSDQIPAYLRPSASGSSDEKESPEQTQDEVPLTIQDEVSTSYVLVNVLLNLLIQKKIITTSEVKPLVHDLQKAYFKKKGGT